MEYPSITVKELTLDLVIQWIDFYGHEVSNLSESIDFQRVFLVES